MTTTQLVGIALAGAAMGALCVVSASAIFLGFWLPEWPQAAAASSAFAATLASIVSANFCLAHVIRQDRRRLGL